MTDAGNIAIDPIEADARSVYVSATDGLRLHVREYGPRLADTLPVVCLPGLARTAQDFDTLARALATEARSPRRVLALDYRGRGLSEYDSDPGNYSLPVELADVIAVLIARGVHRAVFVGTSRGGILAMLLAAAQPTRIAGVVLNDIGPVLEPIGLVRIKGYVGKLPQPRDLVDGGEILKRLFDAQFPKFSADDWRQAARRTWSERDGALVLNYDARLAQTLEGIEIERPLPALWPQFDALAQVPLMVLRGALSDLLSPATVEAMRSRHDGLEVVEVPDQGHAPTLEAPDLLNRIAAFARKCDEAASPD